MPTPPTPQASIVVGGETILLEASPRVAATQGCRHKKETRAKMSESDLADMLKSATEKMSHKFTMVAPKTDDEESLKEYATLSQLIRATKERHAHYDMMDVFQIVFPTDVANSPDLSITRPSTDLYTNYLSVTADEVALSCQWYATWPTADTFGQNLSETFNFFRQNCSMSLYHKVLESYDSYPASQRGGPLFFKLMLDILVADHEIVADTLISRLKSFKISTVQGENVPNVVSLVRNACRRLHDIYRLPQNIPLILLDLYQTTSVPEFNSIFAAESSARQYAALSPASRVHQHAVYDASHQDKLFADCEDINGRADSAYTKLRGTWKVPKPRSDGGASLVAVSKSPDNSAKDKDSDPTAYRRFSFAVLLSGVCWNCGSGEHNLRTCPHPRNERKVAANREQFHKARAKANKGGGKSSHSESSGKPSMFAPPRPEENGRRVINDVAHTWDATKKWWSKESSNVAAAPASAPAGDVQASLAALTRQFGATVSALNAVASQVKQA